MKMKKGKADMKEKMKRKKRKNNWIFRIFPSACYMLCSRNLHQSAYQAACIESGTNRSSAASYPAKKEIARLENAKKKADDPEYIEKVARRRIGKW